MAKNLSTPYLFKQFIGATVATTTNDALYTRLIDQVSDALSAHCGRVWELTTYYDWLDGSGTGSLLLPQFPIARLYGMALGTVGVGTIKYTGGKWATASIRDSSLYQDYIGTDGVPTHATAVAFSASKTMTALAAAVASGWTLTVASGKDSEATVLLKPMDAVQCLDPDTADLEIADLTDGVKLVENSNQSIERLGGFSTFPCGRSNIFVWYQAGYTLPVGTVSETEVGNVPDDLELICNTITKSVLDASKQKLGAMQSEKIGNYSYALGAGSRAIINAAIMDHSAALLPHRSMKLI